MLRSLLTVAVAAVVVASLALSAPARAKDDPKKMKASREKVRAKLVEKGGMPFYDLFYNVDAKKLEDSRWSQLPVDNKKWRSGLQFLAKWEMVTSGGTPKTIQVSVFKAQHRNGNSESVREFKHWGKTVKWSNPKGLMEGFYEDYRRSAKDVIEDKCVEPTSKVKSGPAKVFASVTATDPNSNARERHDWYVWTHGKYGSTYKVEITFSEGLLKSEGLLAKGKAFVSVIKEVKSKKVKWQ